jgi:hypothetical protein
MLLGLVCLCAFGQTQPKQVLTMADLDSFIRNFTAIEEFFAAHEEEFAPLREELEVTDGADLTAALMKMRGFAVSEEVNSDLAGLGLGSNGFEKIIVITHGIGVVLAGQMLQSLEEDPEGARIVEEQLKSLKDTIHADDVSLIASRAEDLMPLMEGR